MREAPVEQIGAAEGVITLTLPVCLTINSLLSLVLGLTELKQLAKWGERVDL